MSDPILPISVCIAIYSRSCIFRTSTLSTKVVSVTYAVTFFVLLLVLNVSASVKLESFSSDRSGWNAYFSGLVDFAHRCVKGGGGDLISVIREIKNEMDPGLKFLDWKKRLFAFRVRRWRDIIKYLPRAGQACSSISANIIKYLPRAGQACSSSTFRSFRILSDYSEY